MNWSDTLQTILKETSPQWIALILDLIESIRTYVKPKSPEGLYEILEYETRLELLDPQGRTAFLTKRERVKFLQDYAIAFQDYAWGEGNVLVP